MDPWLEHLARANFRRSADTAHDLKTPLNVAVLNLELVRMRCASWPDDDEKLAVIRAGDGDRAAPAGQHLRRLLPPLHPAEERRAAGTGRRRRDLRG